MPEAALSFSNIRKTYGAGLLGARRQTLALDGVSVEIGAGEIVGIAGAPGAGKSTLLRIATGMLRPDSGIVQWSGALQCPPHFAGFVPSHAAMHGFLTVAEALRFSAIQRELRTGRRLGGPSSWIERLGLVRCLGTRVSALAPVERRLVALVAALQPAPALLAIDGALEGLDPAARRTLRAALHTIAGRGVALLLGAADLGVLAGVAHRAALLRDGRVVAWVDPRVGAPLNALELAVGAPRAAAARLRRHLPAAWGRDGAVRVPLADRSAEDVLALCRAEGIHVLRSRVVTEPPGRWTVPPAPG